MSKQGPANLAHSVHVRLLALAKREGIDFNVLLSRYVIERFLYRLSRSKHRDRFVLKGAMLFAVWMRRPHRSTRDLDLLGLGDLSEAVVPDIFREIFAVPVEADGVVFDPQSIEVSDIRPQDEYRGRRVRVTAHLGTARLRLQVDIGIGDALTPAAQEVTYPVLLDMPAPKLKAYARETVIAEKLHAMATLGMLSSRMKDLYDLWAMAEQFSFDGQTLAEAIRATFERRKAQLGPALPAGLTDEFSRDPTKQTQWGAFLRKHDLSDANLGLNVVTGAVRDFLEPPLRSAASGQGFAKHWPAGGPWI